MFSSMKLDAMIAMAFVVMLGIGYWYFNWSQNRIAILAADNAKLTMAVQEQQDTIKSMKEFAEKQAKDLTQLQSNLSESEGEKSRLSEQLSKHDLPTMARKKPELLEKKINDASKKVLKEISGAK